MLEYMRKNAGSWVIKILLFGIAIVFSFWGVGSYTNRNVNTVVTIDEVKVPYNEYRDIYNTLVDTYRQMYENLDSATLDFLDIRTQALDSLIERYLFLEAARRMKVEVSGDEVAAEVAATPSFQENGLFSPQRYRLFLDLNRMTPEAYETTVARDLTLQKVTDLIKLSAVITPQEVEDNLRLLTRKAVARVVRLSPNDFVRQVGPSTEEEIQAFFEENLEIYRVPEKFRQTIAVIDPLAMQATVQVSAEEMEEWYEDRETEYTEEASYRLGHILFALPQAASAESINAVRVRAEEAVSMIRDDKISFEEAVRRFSDDKDSAARKGDLGFLEESALERAVRDAVGDLPPGEVSEPLPTARGFQIIRVLEVRPQRLIPFGEVRDDIEKKLRKERAFELAYDQADDLLDELQGSERSLEELAREKGLMTITTPLFSRGSPLETLELPRDLLEATFDTEEGEIGDIYEREGKLYLFQTTERNESYLPELDEVRDQVEGGLLVKKAMELARGKGEEMVEALKGGQSLPSLANSLRKRIVTTEPFTVMDSNLGELDDAGAIIRTAFSIDKPGQAALADGVQAQYIVLLERFIDPTEEERKENLFTIREALRFQREQDVLKSFVLALREEMKDKITINQDLL